MPNSSYRSHVGSLNWLSMGLRYDLVYTTKELSRALAEPTKTSNETLRRALTYAVRTKHAKLVYDHEEMIKFQPPATRKKPG